MNIIEATKAATEKRMAMRRPHWGTDPERLCPPDRTAPQKGGQGSLHQLGPAETPGLRRGLSDSGQSEMGSEAEMTLDNATISALARVITAEKLADFFSDPVNLEGFEAWKAERETERKEKGNDGRQKMERH